MCLLSTTVSFASAQNVQFTLANMSVGLAASRLMVREGANAMDERRPTASASAAAAKLFACDTCYKVIDDALQLHGGYGYLADYPIEVRDLIDSSSQ